MLRDCSHNSVHLLRRKIGCGEKTACFGGPCRGVVGLPFGDVMEPRSRQQHLEICIYARADAQRDAHDLAHVLPAIGKRPAVTASGLAIFGCRTGASQRFAVRTPGNARRVRLLISRSRHARGSNFSGASAVSGGPGSISSNL